MFLSNIGLIQFICVPLGLNTSPGAFQRAEDVVLSKLHWLLVLFCLDDIVKISKRLKAHTKHVRTVLTLICDVGVALVWIMAEVFSTVINYLSHVIRTGPLAES